MDETTPDKLTITYSISITGLQLKSVYCYPKFYWYALSAVRGAKLAPGNIYASTNAAYIPMDETLTHMTLTVWKDRAATMKYVASKEHREAAKLSRELASNIKSYHYESETIPTWEVAKQILADQGVEYNL
jgi:heme-degrading monooxygenase HmoA